MAENTPKPMQIDGKNEETSDLQVKNNTFVPAASENLQNVSAENPSEIDSTNQIIAEGSDSNLPRETLSGDVASSNQKDNDAALLKPAEEPENSQNLPESLPGAPPENSSVPSSEKGEKGDKEPAEKSEEASAIVSQNDEDCNNIPAAGGAPGGFSPAEQIYHVKWVEYFKAKMPTVTQNENGPCPLLAIMNILLLRGQVRLPDDAAVVTGQQLMERLGDCILRLEPNNLTESLRQDYQHNVSDAVAVLTKLMTGLDVNVRFTGISDFEYTRECIVFDLLNIPLYHGWLVDPAQREMAAAVGPNSYNQLVEFIITNRTNVDDPDLAAQAAAGEIFLAETASQLTYHGLCELNEKMKDGELAVFFRNNHFSTVLKNRDELFLLVTDQGFLHEPSVVWETLNNVDGDTHFVDASFHTAPPKDDPPQIPNSDSDAEQINRDYMIALSLEQQNRPNPEGGNSPNTASATSASPQAMPVTVMPPSDDSDAQLAWALQQEEERLAQEEAVNDPRGRNGGELNETGGQQQRRPSPPQQKKEDKTCTAL